MCPKGEFLGTTLGAFSIIVANHRGGQELGRVVIKEIGALLVPIGLIQKTASESWTGEGEK